MQRPWRMRAQRPRRWHSALKKRKAAEAENQVRSRQRRCSPMGKSRRGPLARAKTSVESLGHCEAYFDQNESTRRFASVLGTVSAASDSDQKSAEAQHAGARIGASTRRV